MTSLSKLMCGITLLTVPTIAYGGYYLLTILAGYEKSGLTDFQRSMFRAGHAHAGVLVLLSLVAQLLLDHTQMNASLELILRIGFPLAAVLVSGGFFAAATGHQLTHPNGLIAILYSGVGLLMVSLVFLGVSLLRSR